MRNETPSWQCRFLSKDHFEQLYHTFIAAFSDYVLPFDLTFEQFCNHIKLNAVDINRTVGCFEGDTMVAFSLNGFGTWNGKQTVYDAGTGVITAKRRQGISEEMFNMMMPLFEEDGIEQFLLEVITTNKAAINLYEKFGFTKVRELALLKCNHLIESDILQPADLEIREIAEPDWELFQTFWDGEPSWQNMPRAAMRVIETRGIIGAFMNGSCIGYIVFSRNLGRVSQLAVAKDYRNQGVATSLIRRTQAEIESGATIQIINIDKSLEDAMKFFKNRGFHEFVSQYEMVKAM